MTSQNDKYIILNKKIGETPLACAEKYRSNHPELTGVSMAYAGRLDPMASGQLLVLLGDECKNQANYHNLDKEYEFSILLGIESDSLDVLGRLNTCKLPFKHDTREKILGDFPRPFLGENFDNTLKTILNNLTGDITLPYPQFSSKTVQGKPLHTWTLEGRLHEIKIPTRKSTVYTLDYIDTTTLSKTELVEQALTKVNSIPPVTDIRKAIGNDFRRVDVRADWKDVHTNNLLPNQYTVLNLKCLASAGTYMRTLASIIGKKLNTCSLAWNIHRTKIGKYNQVTESWSQKY